MLDCMARRSSSVSIPHSTGPFLPHRKGPSAFLEHLVSRRDAEDTENFMSRGGGEIAEEKERRLRRPQKSSASPRLRANQILFPRALSVSARNPLRTTP